MATLTTGHGRSLLNVRDERAHDRVHVLTLWLRARRWSEESILALKVAVSVGMAMALGCALAYGLHVWGVACYILL